MFNIPARCWHSVIIYFDQQTLLHSQIAKPAGTDFEQSMQTTFDNRKATNYTTCNIKRLSNCFVRDWQNLLDILCQHIDVKNQAESANGIWWQIVDRTIGRLSVVKLYQQTLLGFCYQSAGIACQQALSTNPEPNADMATIMGIWSILPIC